MLQSTIRIRSPRPHLGDLIFSNLARLSGVMILLSLAGMGYGLYGFKKASPNIALPAFLTVVVVAGLLIDFQGIWLAGVLILAVSLLVIVIALGQAVRS